MSILQVSNIHFESTGNNRIQSSSNTITIVAGGANVIVANTTAIAVGSVTVGNSTVNSSITSASLNVGNSSITTSDITVGNTIVANSTNISLRTSNIERFRVATDGSFTSVIPSGSTLLPTFMCRAWVNFNGTGTVSIRGSGNVSSITRLGTGEYRINFITAMPDTLYSYSHAYSNEINVQHALGFLRGFTISTTSFEIEHYNAANGTQKADKAFVFIVVFR
jgi:hypothetical protein